MSKKISTKKRNNKLLGTLILGYESLGAIYGDIGTSPLYTLSSVFPDEAPDTERLLGGISCIFWTFTLMVIFKYCLIVLKFGPNHNEGGQIAIYSKIISGLKLKKPNNTVLKEETYDDEETYTDDIIPREEDLITLTRTTTVDTSSSIFSNKFVRSTISVISLACALMGCSLVFSDGLLTPTTSVLSAISGIATAVPSFTDKVMPVSCAVLVILFLSQKFGSNKLTILFSPIILIWLIALAVNGLYWICLRPEILKAFNPAYAFKLLIREKGIGVLSRIMLCITGAEAMFADVSHFGARPIQITLFFVVYPCLMCAYFGQGAYILIDPKNFSDNLFYTSIPFGGVGSPYYWFIFVLATLATIIASQALILGCFAILKQLINLDCFPRMTQIHTSKKQKGRVYIPVANYVLMVAVVLTTIGFQNSNNVTAAYGLGISIDFLMTTTLIAIVLHYIYNYHWIFSVLFFVIFGSFEMCLIISGLKKFTQGAWFPVLMCIICFSSINFWRVCRSLSLNSDLKRRKSVQDMFGDRMRVIEQKRFTVLDLGNGKRKGIITTGTDSPATPITENPSKEITEERPSCVEIADEDENGSISSENSEYVNFKDQFGSVSVQKIQKIALIYCSSYSTIITEQSIPSLLRKIVSSFWSLPQVCIFIETRVSPLPNIPEDHPKATVLPVSTSSEYDLSFYRCVIRSGFMKQTKIDESIIKDIRLQIRDFEDDPEIMKLPLMHILERDITVSKRIESLCKKSHSGYDSDNEERENENTFAKKLTQVKQKCVGLIKYPGYCVRKLAIDWIYSPLSNGSLEYILDDRVKEKNTTEFIYVGEKVYI